MTQTLWYQRELMNKNVQLAFKDEEIKKLRDLLMNVLYEIEQYTPYVEHYGFIRKNEYEARAVMYDYFPRYKKGDLVLFDIHETWIDAEDAEVVEVIITGSEVKYRINLINHYLKDVVINQDKLKPKTNDRAENSNS